MREVVILGVGMHPFGRFLEKNLADLAHVAIRDALKDAAVPAKDIQVAYLANSIGGLITGQEGIRAQTVLGPNGFGGIPMVNVENACASASTAFRGVWLEIASGLYDVGLAVGVEKMHLEDRARTISALISISQVELSKLGMQFVGEGAMRCKRYMRRYGATREDLALVAVKNSYNGSLNPYAFHRKPYTHEEVLNSALISEPLHLFMTSSIADGAAAAVLCAREVADRYESNRPITVAGCALMSGRFRESDPLDTDAESTITLTAREAYKQAGMEPKDIDVAEVHDAMSPIELISTEDLGFCGKGEAVRYLKEGRTKISGDIPINTSGGLCSRGHPVGATGIAQIAEIVWQLRGEAGPRQVKDAKVGMCEDSGGVLVNGDNAAFTNVILKR
ncbi:MAG: acetyl-CoA acetyltransferase [Syntrophorhabdaceae bacterium PtaU1.Bin034]|nr:MAG: acetyl-CoA acetyltransferase [Syntrophorhabdaceae bacterium PtaU1.Bin034]